MNGPLEVDFVDGVGGSTSLRIVSDHVRAVLDGSPVMNSRHPRRLLDGVPGLSRRRPAVPVLVFFLAHHLGRAAAQSPGLVRPRLRAVLTGWEIEQLTDILLEELAGADVLLAISDFGAEVFRRHFPDTPVLTVPICPPLPDRARPDRARWGIPAEATVFLNVFDPISGFDRKNPIDVHAAFSRAFPGRDDVRLVFKVHGGFAKSPDEGNLTGEVERAARFLELCAADERVILIDELLAYGDLLRLVASSDAYVSLARAEGLGLPVLEAMALGVPTVCTAYAGHLDFARPDANLLVPYELIDIGQTASHFYHPRAYGSPPRWAQPDVAAAAGFLRDLADDPGLRQRLSRSGRDAAAAHARRSREAAWVRDLARLLDSPHVRRRHPSRDRAWRSVVERDRAVWVDHERDVRRARAVLTVRTRLGRVKRRVRRALGLGPGADPTPDRD